MVLLILNSKTVKRKYNIEERLYYSVLRLAYQIYHPEEKINTTEIISNTCGNIKCFSKEHLKLGKMINNKENQDKFDFEKAYETLSSKCKRLEPEGDQKVGCLVWTGKVKEDGYSRIQIQNHRYVVHLFALFIKRKSFEKPIDELNRELVTCHGCKNKNCIEHVDFGTYDQNNIDDKKRDGTFPEGENHHNALLTNEIVKKIKESWKPEGDPNFLSKSTRANMFGVSVDIIGKIDRGECWAHIKVGNELDKIIEENIKKRKENIANSRVDVRTNGLSIEEYTYLKYKIYNNSTIQESKDNLVNNTPCRIWNGHQKRSGNNELTGYGIIYCKNVPFFVHVVVCCWKNKCNKPENMIVRHLCNNRTCVEAEHLEFKSHSENAIHAFKTGTKGMKLSFEKAREIRKILSDDSSTSKRKELAEKYGVGLTAINDVFFNRRWIEK